jgi:hypothetical protein
VVVKISVEPVALIFRVENGGGRFSEMLIRTYKTACYKVGDDSLDEVYLMYPFYVLCLNLNCYLSSVPQNQNYLPSNKTKIDFSSVGN